ncbi:hypothetical protein [Paracoccus spongiarum]|uniref:Uncharacterized protein n=1 Tax=Paracoccus spongiarum TaxID=3064387 RepID=A0ABT9JA23_9RHOB|nr:hypothetical protein [Paracoccus sp. 2205BS29-5]MDP5306663.1 hypothetical protein [Paracoccus sp. 2205BS29-5]
MPAAPLCVLLGAGFLADPGYSVNPDAVATAGAAIAIRAEAGAGRLSVAAEGPGLDRLREIARIAAGARAADDLAASCPPEADRIMLVDHAGREAAGREILWPPAMADAGAGPAPEIARAIREFLGLAVPRPLPPDRHPVTVMRLAAPVAADLLLSLAFASPWTSWHGAGGSVYVALDDAAGIARLVGLPGSRILGEEIPLGRLRLLGGVGVEGARPLDRWPEGQLAVCAEPCDTGRAWLDDRFDRDTGTGG